MPDKGILPAGFEDGDGDCESVFRTATRKSESLPILGYSVDGVAGSALAVVTLGLLISGGGGEDMIESIGDKYRGQVQRAGHGGGAEKSRGVQLIYGLMTD